MRVELRFADLRGDAHSLWLTGREAQTRQGGIELSANTREENGASVVRASVANRSGASILLGEARFEIATGFPPNAPARFFKHGYQSWSSSGIATVGDSRHHRRDDAPSIVRLSHQSETVRPPEMPEVATSELFTVLECEGCAERILVGFIGAAGQFGTVAVTSPERATGRLMLDRVALAPGESRELEPLVVFRSEKSIAALAARWAAMLGHAMGARTGAPYQRGWCSWYHYFHGVTEDAMLANLRVLAAMRNEYPIDVVQLDDGYQSALGDWDSTNAKFPSGLGKLADEIRRAGFTPGLWTAPFLASRDSRLMNAHPDWFIVHESGEPLRAGYNPNWSATEDAFAYALDPSHPAFTEHLERLFERLARKLGYSYLKLDFLYAGAAEGRRHYAQDLTRAETLRRGLQAIRRGAGDDAFILGCGCPLGQAVGIVDGMRIGEDVAPYWESTAPQMGVPGTAQALEAVIARSFMHRRLWLNDPDCLMLRAKETGLSDEERHSLAATVAASGGMLLISDDMSLLTRESAILFQAVAAIGAQVDGASHDDEPPLAVEPAPPGIPSTLRILSKRLADGSIHLALNRGEESERMEVARLDSIGFRCTVFELGKEEREAHGTLEIPPHAARLVRFRR